MTLSQDAQEKPTPSTEQIIRAKDKALEDKTRKNVLQNQSLSSFFQAMAEIGKKFLVALGSFCLFGGFLFVMLSLANLHSQADLALHLLPFFVIALPFGLLAPRHHSWMSLFRRKARWTWYDLLAVGFVLCFVGMFVWSVQRYFSGVSPNSHPIWLIPDFLLLLLLVPLYLRARKARWRGRTQSIMIGIWMLGIGTILALMGILFYFMWYNLTPEAATSMVLAVGTFLFFLVVVALRVLWLDGERSQRADRTAFSKRSELSLLFELLIPNSYPFLIFFGFLLVAEGMMFSTIYNAQEIKITKQTAIKQHKEAKKLRKLTKSQKALLAKSKEQKKEAKKPSGEEEKASGPVSLFSWVVFAFRPDEFPKKGENEVGAPQWFKYLAPALYGLFITFLLRQQFGIWQLFMGLYQLLTSSLVRLLHVRNARNTIELQQQEALANFNAQLNERGNMWRSLLYGAITAPPDSVKSTLILDPMATVSRVLGAFKKKISEHWGGILSVVGLALLVLAFPFYWKESVTLQTMLKACIPALAAGIFLLTLRYLLSLQPPKVYHSAIWGLLVVHVLLALGLFFLTLIAGKNNTIWSNLLWYGSIISIGVFPAIYLFGGERHRQTPFESLDKEVWQEDSNFMVRKMMFSSMLQSEHRVWLVGQLAESIHPIRSGGIQLRLILPSVVVQILEWLKWFKQNVLVRIFGNLTNTAVVGMIIQVVVLFFVFFWDFLLQRQLPALHNHILTLICLLAPAITVLSTWQSMLWKERKAQKENKAPEDEAEEDKAEEKRVLPSVPPVEKRKLFFGILFGTSYLATIVWLYQHTTVPSYHPSGTVFFILEGILFCMFSYSLLYEKKPKKAKSENTSAPLKGIKGKFVALKNRIQGLFQVEELEKQEEEVLKKVFSQTEIWRNTSPQLRKYILRECVAPLHSARKSLISGQWYEEEEHALQRVIRSYLTEHTVEVSERMDFSDELATLTQQTLEPLWTLLYDLTKKDWLDEIESFSDLEEMDDYIRLILEKLDEILQTPLPLQAQSNLSTHDATEAKEDNEETQDDPADDAYGELRETLQSIHDFFLSLLLSYTEGSEQKEHSLTNERFVSLLEAQFADYLPKMLRILLNSGQFQADQSLTKDLFDKTQQKLRLSDSDAHRQTYAQLSELVQAFPFLATEKEEPIQPQEAQQIHQAAKVGKLLNQLPTPLALMYQRQLAKMEELAQLQAQTPENPQILNRTLLEKIHRPDNLCTQEEKLAQEERRSAQKEELLAFTRQCQRAVFGYVFGMLKSICISDKSSETGLTREAKEKILAMNWQESTTLEQAIQILQVHQNAQPFSGLIQLLKGLYQIYSNKKSSSVPQAITKQKQALQEAHELFEELLLLVLQHQNAIPELAWEVAADGMTVQKNAEPTQSSPEKAAVQLGTGIRLRNMNTLPQLEFKACSWFVHLLNELAHSEGLLYYLPEDPQAEDKSNEKLSQDAQAVEQLHIIFKSIHPQHQLHSEHTESTESTPQEEDSSAETISTEDSITPGEKLLIQRVKNRELVEAIALRFGRWVENFAPEQQKELSDIFEKAWSRLKMLENNKPEHWDSISGTGSVDFPSTLEKLTLFLDGLEQRARDQIYTLLLLHILPSQEFMYLVKVEKLEESEGELQWYQSTKNGQTEVLFESNPQLSIL